MAQVELPRSLHNLQGQWFSVYLLYSVSTSIKISDKQSLQRFLRPQVIRLWWNSNRSVVRFVWPLLLSRCCTGVERPCSVPWVCWSFERSVWMATSSRFLDWNKIFCVFVVKVFSQQVILSPRDKLVRVVIKIGFSYTRCYSNRCRENSCLKG